jgi:hypothetical protein
MAMVQWRNAVRVFVTTLNSVYEVWLRDGRFRRVSGSRDGAPPVGVWQRFERVSPLRRGSPMRFFVRKDTGDGVPRIGLVTTSPVVDVIEDTAEDQTALTG